jgi:Sulfotransferase domain
MSKEIKRICLWSSPRNVSTAFMYSFAQRSDTTVVDEPLYGYFLKESGADHPGKEVVISAMECNFENIVRNELLGEYPTPVVFFKHMPHHMVGNVSPNFMGSMFNLFFIRDPKLILRSYAKVIDKPTLEGIGIQLQKQYLEIAKDNHYSYAVLDSADLLKNPEKILIKLCSLLEIPFEKNMLSWKIGARKEDGVWAKYWYNNVHQSNGFEKYKEKEINLPKHLEEIYQEAKPFYDYLIQHTIKI